MNLNYSYTLIEIPPMSEVVRIQEISIQIQRNISGT